jgi:Ca2+-binding RTX toxin-like protein
MPGETEGPSHQISNLTIGPDGKLYVHNGDGFDPSKALNMKSFRGKVLRMNLDGSAPADNPFYDASNGIDATDYIYAYGFRNPFGGDWRAANDAQYEVENGPSVDRFAKIDRGASYGWDGTDDSMHTNALYNWTPAHAPVNLTFVQRQTFLGSGFPGVQMDHAFVAESGPTYTTGPQELGKRIVEFDPQPGGEMGGHPHGLVEYTGTGKGTAVGLGAGPDGLYWTELYKDQNYTSAIDPGARLLRVSYVGTAPSCQMNGRTLEVTAALNATTRVTRLPDGEIQVDGNDCGATVLDVNDIAVTGAEGNENVVLDLAAGPLAPGYLDPAGRIGVSIDLGTGRDTLSILEGAGADTLELHGNGASSNGGVSTLGVELVRAFGGTGPDRLAGNGRRNELFGGPGPDELLGRSGADLLKGERGKDRFAGGRGRDRCDARPHEPANSCELPAR